MKPRKTYGFFSPRTGLAPSGNPYDDMKSYQRFRSFFGGKDKEAQQAEEKGIDESGARRVYLTGIVTGIALAMAAMAIASVYIRRAKVGQSLDSAEKIAEIMSVLDRYSINEYKTADLEENMYRGLVSGIGDPYTAYFDKDAHDDFMQQTEGTYGGIGVVVTQDPNDSLITVVTLYEGAPGAAAGMLPGDKFMKVNGEDVTNSALDEVTSKTKGPAGTIVTITVYRPSEKSTFDIRIVREKIDVPTVLSKVVGGDKGYIRISAFDRITYDQFKDAYDSVNKAGITGLIIDLRNNPGGLLDVVSKITDILVPKGILVYTEDKNGNKDYTYSDDTSVKVPLAILVNGSSASASEVLSGAVKDLKAGVLVGEKTFGKGIVQNLYPLSDGSAVKVTVAKYYTPNGICIQGDGLTPDYPVELDPDLATRLSTLEEENDTQLQKAIEVLGEMAKMEKQASKE
ncbi:MAG: S41 family peptidase [Clostridiales bacterium]|jgi:carboxyl-terminal processing protease|nr:S41 family peptidase [Clostridiales bacterium]MDR2749155.1 S41 family peptidase [Clostridiales bacterium]